MHTHQEVFLHYLCPCKLLSMSAFMCKIIFDWYLALESSFLKEPPILFETVSMISYSHCQKPECDSWAKWIFAGTIIIRFTVSLPAVLTKISLYLIRPLHHHKHACSEQSVRVNRPSHLCLQLSTWPQSDSLLESSVRADWQWEQPGQRPESSGASWPSHTMWSWLMTQNRCTLKQHKKNRGRYIEKECSNYNARAWSPATMIRLVCRLFKNSNSNTKLVHHDITWLCQHKEVQMYGSFLAFGSQDYHFT